MAFIVFVPPIKQVQQKTTSQSVHLQLWHELEILRFKGNGKEAEPYITQGRIYFLDAWSANWRSAGLLYYYSFLNLAKAMLLNRKIFSLEQMQNNKLHHGLGASPSEPNSFIDFKIDILPHSKGQRIFTHLYKDITGFDWPFNETVTITIKDLLPYCADISDEVQQLYPIASATENVHSLVRLDEANAWHEVLCTEKTATKMKEEMPEYQLTVSSGKELSAICKHDWLIAMNFTTSRLNAFSIVKSPLHKIDNDKSKALIKCQKEARKHFQNFAFFSGHTDDRTPSWIFSPRITIQNQKLHWHPLLSNYILLFALGSALRYQPHIFNDGTPDYFIAEACIRQIPITTLRHFLLFYNAIGVEIFPI